MTIQGKCGNDITFTACDGTLTLTGKGEMYSAVSFSTVLFNECRDEITDLIVGDGITVIGDYAFASFPRLCRVSLPEGLEIIGTYAFTLCDSLTRIDIPEGVRLLGPKAFEKCPLLAEVSLPSTLRAIDFKAFNDDAAIVSVRYNGTEREWNEKICISTSARGNRSLTDAAFTFNDHTAEYYRITHELSAIIGHGDGKLYILAPDLTVPDINDKSGDCQFIIFPDGKTMLIDAAASPCSHHVIELLAALGLRSLDYFVISHPHGDHVGGGKRVAAFLTDGVGEYISSGFEFKKAERALSDILAANGCRIRRDLRAGDRITVGDVNIDFYNPFDEDMHPDSLSDAPVNNASLVMKFTYGTSTYLTSGDLYATREAYLVEKYGDMLRADTAKTNHHGNYTSNTEGWFAAIRPCLLVSHCDDAIWTLFAERLARENIAHYRVSECGLTVISTDGSRRYIVESEYGAHGEFDCNTK